MASGWVRSWTGHNGAGFGRAGFRGGFRDFRSLFPPKQLFHGTLSIAAGEEGWEEGQSDQNEPIIPGNEI